MEHDNTLAAPSRTASVDERAKERVTGAGSAGASAGPLDRTATLDGPSPTPAAGGELAPGVRLGHFKIERKLGAGGMGEVYLATDLALDRPVAVKVLPSGVASGAARDRMIKEARAQARVHHPNVAHIYFIGEEAGRLYFAMEYVTGKTLAERIAEGPLPVEDALAVIRAAVLGLREAQRSGFTHRDVKPSNLMVDGHGVLKVLDFGLVAGTTETAGSGPVAQTTLAGTPLYMAPEQARGEPVDHRADIYALGATLYHLVSGRPPYVADTVDELATLHASAERPTLPRGALPRTTIHAIDALIARMMARRPDDRFASYDELVHALELASAQYTRPAGFWVRSIATAIDILLMIVLHVVIENVALGGDDGVELGLVTLPLLAVYSALAIGRFGTTAGKALFELEVVSYETGKRPTWGQAFRRQLVLVCIPVVAAWCQLANARAGEPVSATVFEVLEVASLVLLFVSLLVASLRVHGKRAAWDRVARTIVRYR